MKSLTNFLDELRENCKIDFMIILENNDIMFDSIGKIENSFKIDISLGKTQAYIIIDEKFRANANLLGYIINSKLEEYAETRDKIMYKLLHNKEVSTKLIEDNLPFIFNEATSFVIYLNSKQAEAMNIVKQLYNREEVAIVIQGEYIILSGIFENPMEHAQSIIDAIFSNMFSKCYISFYSTSNSIESFKDNIKRAKESIEIGLLFDVKGEIFLYDEMLFGKVVNTISKDIQNELVVKFKDSFNAFDSELILTIEEFFNCGLSISDTAKVLYVHRNTLIYRLDKILRETGYDLRNFKNAIIFLVSFLLWKKYRGNIV